MPKFSLFLSFCFVSFLGSILNSSIGQTQTQGPIRTVLALDRVSSVVEAPMQMKLARVMIPAGATADYIGGHSLIYLLSGAIFVVAGDEKQSVQQGDGALITARKNMVLQSGPDAAAEILQFQLVSMSDSGTSLIRAPAITTELHRMAMPPTLKPGPHELSLTRVTIPAGSLQPRAHTRSGAALYYVLSGGSITFWPSATVDGLVGESRTEPRPAGAIQEEPFGFIHSWSPKADSALLLLQATVSQEGAPEIIFVK